MKYIYALCICFTLLSCREAGSVLPDANSTLPDGNSAIPFFDLDELHRNHSKFPVPLPPPTAKDARNLVPSDYRIVDEIAGDFNHDRLEDRIFMIKATDWGNIIESQYERGHMLDLNRRGILIALNRGEHYERVVFNPECFHSEDEPGGTYIVPVISLETDGGNLVIMYNHWRYGYWTYTFRFIRDRFELTGYYSYYMWGHPHKIIDIDFLANSKTRSFNSNFFDADYQDEDWNDYPEDMGKIPLWNLETDLNLIPDMSGFGEFSLHPVFH